MIFSDFLFVLKVLLMGRSSHFESFWTSEMDSEHNFHPVWSQLIYYIKNHQIWDHDDGCSPNNNVWRCTFGRLFLPSALSEQCRDNVKLPGNLIVHNFGNSSNVALFRYHKLNAIYQLASTSSVFLPPASPSFTTMIVFHHQAILLSKLASLWLLSSVSLLLFLLSST